MGLYSLSQVFLYKYGELLLTDKSLKSECIIPGFIDPGL